MKFRDLIFLAIMAAAITLAGFVFVPLVLAVPIPGIRSIPPAPFYGFLLALGLMKTRRPGSILIMVTLNGVVLLIMSYLMFFNNLIAGILTELIVLLLFRSYKKDWVVCVAAGLYMPLTIPANILTALWVGGEYLAKFFLKPWLLGAIIAGTAALSFAGAFAGLRLGKELVKAGRLKPSAP